MAWIDPTQFLISPEPDKIPVSSDPNFDAVLEAGARALWEFDNQFLTDSDVDSLGHPLKITWDQAPESIKAVHKVMVATILKAILPPLKAALAAQEAADEEE